MRCSKVTANQSIIKNHNSDSLTPRSLASVWILLCIQFAESVIGKFFIKLSLRMQCGVLDYYCG